MQNDEASGSLGIRQHLLPFLAEARHGDVLDLDVVEGVDDVDEALVLSFVSGSDEARTAALVDYLRALIDDVQLPATQEAAKVKESDLEMLAGDAMLQQRLLINNPRDVAYEDALAIYRAAYRSAA